MGEWKFILPEATTNLPTNPSFETGTTGYTAEGSNTIAQSSTVAFKGNYSLQSTYQDSGTLWYYTITLTAAAHAFSAWVYLPSTWNGGAISLAIDGFTGATTNTASNSTSTTGQWVELKMVFTPDGGDLSGNLQVITDSGATAGRVIYTDAVQVELKSYSTTYCDGDQPGCSWNGTRHASTSTRLAGSREGGRVYDFYDDYSFKVQRWPGTGMSPVQESSAEHPSLPGSEHYVTRPASRMFVLAGTIVGTSFANLHVKRQALIEALSPFAYPGEEPIIIRYTGASVTKDIKARYISGLEFDRVTLKLEQVNILFKADDPRWSVQGESAAALATSTLTTRLILGKINGAWDDLGPPNVAGTYTSIRDIKIGPNGLVYVCGVFQNFDNIANADYIAAYNPFNGTWSAVGAPSTGATITSILKMAFSPSGILYVVGNFLNLAGVAAADYIAQWDGTNWTAVGTPNSGATITDVRAVAFGWNNRLWVGGDFTNLAGVAAADYIAYYQVDTTTWTAGGTTGANAYVTDIWAHAHIDQVYATGNFTTIDSVSAARIARRELGTWTAMSSGLNNPGTKVIVANNQFVYVMGQFTTAGAVTSTGVAFWNGEKFVEMGAGVDDPAHNAAQLSSGSIAVTGSFDNLVTVLGGDDIPVNGVGIWSGSTWTPPEFSLPSASTVYGVAANSDGDVYYGYDTTGNTVVPNGTTVTNNGTAPVWPLFYVAQSGGAKSALTKIENATTGRKLTFQYEFDPGTITLIDLRPKTLGMYRLDGAAPSARFFRFGPDSDLTDFSLAAGSNLINMYFSTGAGATVTAFIRWVDSYESID